MIQLRVLGTLHAHDDARGDLDELLAQPKVLALLVFLALARPQAFQQRDRLVGLFWPEQGQDAARAALRKALHRLRAVVGEDVAISRGNESLGLTPGGVWCDAVAFDASIDAGRLREALDLYHGDLLPGFYVPGSAAFEQWLEGERAHYRARALGAAWSLVERYEGAREFTNASQLARRVAVLASSDERMLRRVLVMLARLGDRAGAMDIYSQFAKRLWTELETRPSEETVRLVESIQAGAV